MATETTNDATRCLLQCAADAILNRGLDLARAEAETAPAGPYDATDEDLADYSAWTQETAARTFLDDSERLTLAELVDRQSDFYRSWGNPCGEMLAQAMERLAMQIRMTGATTPAELDARIESLDAGVRETWEAIGFEQGRSTCPCHGEIR